MKHSVKKSWAFYDRACRVIPMGTQTHSKAPRESLRHVEPCFVTRAEGCRIWDLDGNEYIDFRCALGPITLGYAYPDVVEAVREQALQGSIFLLSQDKPASLEEGKQQSGKRDDPIQDGRPLQPVVGAEDVPEHDDREVDQHPDEDVEIA